MRRGLLVVMTLALLGASLFGISSKTGAHPVTVNETPVEWSSFGTGPNEDNTGHIIRNALGQGEFAWFDEDYDHRTITSTRLITREVDLRQVRVTGDGANLSMYIVLANLSEINPNPTIPLVPPPDLPQIQIAIDRTLNGAGQTSLISPATTISPTLTAPWEFLLRTQFPQGVVSLDGNYNSAPLRLYNAPGPGVNRGASVMQAINNTIELQIPWSEIGGFPTGPIRFTVVALRESGAGPNPPDGKGTNILDTVTPRLIGQPGGVANTLNELDDGDIDYSFEVRFDPTAGVTSAAQGEVYSPLLITEVGLFPTTISNNGQSLAQWIEITNVSGATVNANQFQLGDAAQRSTSTGESMYQLPNKNLASGQSIIVTRTKSEFEAAYPSLVGNANVYAVNDLTKSNNWATGNLTMRATGLITETISEQVALLDSKDTIVDLVEYTDTAPLAKSYPDHVPVLVPSVDAPPNVRLVPNTSIQRCPGNRDTNNRDETRSDWVVSTTKAEQTPLAPCAFADLKVSKTGPQSIVVNALNTVEQSYVINYANTKLGATTVKITDTLPLGMSYVAAQSQSVPDIGQPQISSAGGREVLVWSIPTVAANATGAITVATSLAAGTQAGTTSNDVAISSATPEAQADQLNNLVSLPVNYTAEPVVDVLVSKGVVTSGASASKLYPGGQVVYRVTYTNNGAKAAGGITLIDTIPQGLLYISNSKNFAADTATPGQVKLTVPGTLAANGGSSTVDLLFAIEERLVEGDTIAANTIAIATTTVPEVDTTNNSAASIAVTLGGRPPAADLQVVKTVKDAANAKPGGTIVYTIAYSNTGEKDAFNVTLTDLFPASLEYQSNSRQLPADTSVAGQVKFTLSPLTIGSRGSFDITFKVKADAVVGTQVTNQASISTTSEEAPITNNSSTSQATEIKANTPVETEKKVYLPVVRK